jgi:hypothetical protein
MLQIILFALFLTLLPAALGYLIVPGGEEETGAYALPAMWCAGFAILMALMHWPSLIVSLELPPATPSRSSMLSTLFFFIASVILFSSLSFIRF